MRGRSRARRPRSSRGTPAGCRRALTANDRGLDRRRGPRRAIAAPDGPKRIAVVTTIYRYLSHAQHIADRFLVGYPYGGEWRKPDMKIVSLYVDQHPEGDQSEERAKEFGFKVYPTIAEALRCGGDKLACDAVLLIGEHGDYPWNELGQHLYPRKRLFDAVVEVFRASGRSVPVFCDKHYSWNFDWAREMFDTAWALYTALDPGEHIRLVGVRAEGLAPARDTPRQLALGAPERGWREAEAAADAAAARFGRSVIGRASLLRARDRSQKENPPRP